MVTLYHYVHCPYCVRVRMALGFLKIPYKSTILPYNDEATPIRLTGIKMLPILEEEGMALNESLEIIKHLDKNDLLDNNRSIESVVSLVDRLSTNIHNLCMPYWIYTQEFDDVSRKYFVQKKSVKRGPFHLLVHNRKKFENELMVELEKLVDFIKPFYGSDQFSICDIILSAHLWGLYIVPEFQFPAKIHHYLQHVASVTSFQYHEDYWRPQIE